MAINGADVVVNVRADTDHADRGLDRTEGKIGGVVGTVGKFAAAAALAGTVAAGAFGVKAVMAASDLNETLSKVTVVFGEASGEVTKFADKMAADFGLPKTQILDAAAGIGLVGKASGLAAGDAAKMSTELASLAADASSFYNVPLEEALGAIKSGLVGEAEPMRRFGVLLNEAAVQAEAVRLGLANAGDELTEGTKAQARASLIMQGMTDASGDLARTQDSLANRLREAQGRAVNFAADVGTKLLPVVLSAMDLAEKWGAILLDRLAPAFAWIGNAAAQVGNLWDVFKAGDDALGGAAEIIDNIFGNTGALIPIVNAVGEAFMRVWPVLQDIGRVLGDVVGPAVMGLAAALGGAGLVAVIGVVGGAIGSLVAALASPVIAIGALIGALIYAYQNFEGFRNLVDTVVAFIVGTVVPAFIQLAGIVIEQLGNAVAWVQKMWPQISEAIDHVMNVVQGAIKVSLENIQRVWRLVGDDIFNIVRSVFRMIAEVIDAVMGIVRGVITTVLAVINGDWGRAWEGIRMIFGGVWDAIVGILRGAWNIISGILGGIWSAISAVLQGVFGGMIGFVRGIPGHIAGAVGDLGRLLVNAGRDVVRGLWDGIASMAGWLADKISGFVKSAIPGPIAKALNMSSPSKVMASMGRDIARGLAIGITDGAGFVEDAVAGLTDTVGVSGGPGGFPGTVPAALAMAGGGASTTIYDVSLDVRGSVLTERDLVDTVRTGLLRTGERNARLGQV